MQITTKELRIQPGRIIDQASRGEEIVVTYRGKIMAKIVPVTTEKPNEDHDSTSIFGMWKSHSDQKSVEDTVRDYRKGREL